MSKFKLNINPKVPNDEQIDKHKDFKKLMHEYDHLVKPLYKVPLYKNKKAFIVLLIILAISFIIAEVLEKEKEKDNRSKPNEEHTKN